MNVRNVKVYTNREGNKVGSYNLVSAEIEESIDIPEEFTDDKTFSKGVTKDEYMLHITSDIRYIRDKWYAVFSPYKGGVTQVEANKLMKQSILDCIDEGIYIGYDISHTKVTDDYYLFVELNFENLTEELKQKLF